MVVGDAVERAIEVDLLLDRGPAGGAFVAMSRNPARHVLVERAGGRQVRDRTTGARGEVRKDVSRALVDDVDIDDFVLIHVGFALNRISPAEAERTLELMDAAGIVAEGTV